MGTFGVKRASDEDFCPSTVKPLPLTAGLREKKKIRCLGKTGELTFHFLNLSWQSRAASRVLVPERCRKLRSFFLQGANCLT